MRRDRYKRHEAVSSVAWTERYDSPSHWPTVLIGEPYSFVDDIRLMSSLSSAEPAMSYPNLNNEPTKLRVDLFSNSYKVFALLWVPRRQVLKRKRVIVPASVST